MAFDNPGKRVQKSRLNGARQRIVANACEMFYRSGIRNVTMDGIAEAAETTKMSLYRYFPSKDELVAEWLRISSTQFWQHWDEIVDEFPDDPRRQLSAIFAWAALRIARPDDRGCPFANTAAEIAEAGHPARELVEAHKRELRARLLKLCEGARALDPESLADSLLLLLEGAHASRQSLGPTGPAHRMARAAEVLIGAHLPRPPLERPVTRAGSTAVRRRAKV